MSVLTFGFLPQECVSLITLDLEMCMEVVFLHLFMATVFMVVSQAPLDLSVSVELSISTFYELLDLEYVLRTLGALSGQ